MIHQKKNTICLTGGHVTPALAVMEEIAKRNPDWQMIFIGRMDSFESGGSPSYESDLVRAFGIPFYTIVAGKLQRTWSRYTLISLLKVPVGMIHAFFLLVKHRPQVVVTFGGYLAVPVVIAAFVLGIPVIIHEQTGALGLANTLVARFARKVLRAQESGVPMRKALFDPPGTSSFDVDKGYPILYITGGSTGARSINNLIFPIIEELVLRYTVIHQTGISDIDKARRIHESLPNNVQRRYVIAAYLHVSDIAWIYAHTALLVGRAGANTTAEVAALGVPAIFIPLPWAAGDEQMKNAQKLVSKGMATILNQKNCSSEILSALIHDMMRRVGHYKKSALVVAKTYPLDAASIVVDEIERILRDNE